MNQIARDEALEEGRETVARDAGGWRFGEEAFQGSVHSDVWEGSAAALLSMKHIAVFPTSGWWKTRTTLGKAYSRVRYSLMVSVCAGGDEIDLYTEIASQIQVPITIETESEV